jgi:serine protease Do
MKFGISAAIHSWMKNLRFILPLAVTVGISTATLTWISSTPANEKTTTVLLQASRALHDIANKATPAVVSITSIKTGDSHSEGVEATTDASEHADQMMMGIGSGVIVRPEGLILTNHHVVKNAESVTVTFDDKHKYTAHVVGTDSKTDLAVIQLDDNAPKNLPTLSFADSDTIQVGDWALAVGSPFGLNRSVTSGIVSAVGRARLGMLDIENFIQTDAAINPGNSGGPLLNVNGDMIGINTAIFSQSGGFIGIGFAIPSKTAKQVLEDILSHGRVIRGWIGMMAQDLDPDLAKYFKVQPDHGALVSQVTPDGPAARAALKAGDVITKYGNNTIQSTDQLKNLVAKTKAVSQVPVEITRDGKINKLNVMITEQPRTMEGQPTQLAGQAGNLPKATKTYPYLGLAVEDVPPEFSSLFGIPVETGALIAAVKTGSPAFLAGLGAGDIILNANKQTVRNAKDFIKFFKHNKDKSLHVLYIQRGPDEKIFVPVKSG